MYRELLWENSSYNEVIFVLAGHKHYTNLY